MQSFINWRACFSFILYFLFFQKFMLFAHKGEVIVGNIRVQTLNENLLRIEQKGSKGFEDRVTFTVVERDWPGVQSSISKNNKKTVFSTDFYRVILPNNAQSLEGIRIESKINKAAFQFDSEIPENDYLPSPNEDEAIWLMSDNPRIIPPAWGATPPNESQQYDPTSGWDISNDAPDIYLFLGTKENYNKFRKDFLKLTGPIPMPPLYTFGLWNSRYFPYSEKTALSTIDTFRQKGIPLDVFVLDTDWRIGASHGYAIDTKLFPNMTRFVKEAHCRNIFLMFNDHPEPVADNALDPKEFNYRWTGLTNILKLGVDAWWYDRNWRIGLKEPMPNLRKEVWGMRVYHDITQQYRPDFRPLIMSNVDGIHSGYWNDPSHPASHRYPIWWTGDQKATWDFLERGVVNGVNSGIQRLMPYVNEDLGGNNGSNPDPDLYLRWVQFGVFSPVTRLHCTKGLTRSPWDYGDHVEKLASEYIRLRYRLLPTIYSAVRAAYDSGMPIMRRCDLFWSDEDEADNPLQYLFGDDLLIAPIVKGKYHDVDLAETYFKTPEGKPGLRGEYYDNDKFQGQPIMTRNDRTIDFFWKKNGGKPIPEMPVDHFAIRWTGKLGPFTEAGQFVLNAIADDGVRIWLDDSLVIDEWRNQSVSAFPVTLNVEKEKIFNIKIEYYENVGNALIQLAKTEETPKLRNVWIPPGFWHNVWSGEIISGPKTIGVEPVLRELPLFVRNGGIIFSIPQMHYTNESPWSTIIVDAYVPLESIKSTTRLLYEDDGISNDYQHGLFSSTEVTLSRENQKVQLFIGGTKGTFKSALNNRTWILRVHLPDDQRPNQVILNSNNVIVKDYKKETLSDSEAFLIQPVRDETMPFCGLNSPPRIQGNPVLELKITGQPVKDTIELLLLYQR